MSSNTSNNSKNNNIREIHLGNYNNDTDCIKSNPSVNHNVNDDEKYCDDNDYETNTMFDMDNADDDDSTCEFVKPRTPWYGSAFVHWLVFDVIG